MTPPIEDTIQPETLNEVLLVNRIRQLHRAAWESGRHPYSWASADPNETPMMVKMITPTLRLAAHSEASLDIPRGLRIEARTEGPRKFGVANYISAEELAQTPPHREAQMLTEVHKRVLHSAAQLVEDWRRQAR